jgi:hypothetical protein
MSSVSEAHNHPELVSSAGRIRRAPNRETMKPLSVRFRFVMLALGLGLLTAGEVWRVRSHRPIPQPPQAPVDDLADCREPPRPVPTSGPIGFVDVTDSLGVDFQHCVGPLGTYFMPESTGCGGALADFDEDGRLDLYLINAGRSPESPEPLPSDFRVENRLFLQQSDGTFADATERSGLGDLGYGAGCAVGDVNNDGHLDLFVTNYGADQLYLGHGDGAFSQAGPEAGIEDDDWGASAAFLDYNRDGWLDLVVVNYTADPVYGHSVACGFREGLVSYCGPHKFQPTVDRLYRNEGLSPSADGRPRVRFTDVTESAGLARATTFGFGVLCADFDADGWPDIFVANDGAPNRLWMNQGNGTFLEEAAPRGAAVNRHGIAEAGMGVAMGDVDHDQDLDLVVTHLTTESTTLYLNDGAGNFEDATAEYELRPPTMRHTGWGVALVDLDWDGQLDLPIVNGLVIPCHSRFPFHGEDQFQVRRGHIEDPSQYWLDYADENVLLMGSPARTFVAQSALGGDFCAALGSGRSLICGDLDQDGDIDAVVTNCGTRARVYRNDFPKRGHFLKLRAVDPKLGRDAIGAEITVVAGERRCLATIQPAGSYLASHDFWGHFGLGEADAYEKIVVRWPDGPVQDAMEEFPGGPADRHVVLQRGSGTRIEDRP